MVCDADFADGSAEAAAAEIGTFWPWLSLAAVDSVGAANARRWSSGRVSRFSALALYSLY